MKVSDLLIASGPFGYICDWIIVLTILYIYRVSPQVQTALIVYAIIPFGSICQSVLGTYVADAGW